MKLTPQALRLISGLAASYADRQSLSRWSSWRKRRAGEDVPGDIAQIVLGMLARHAEHLEQRIDSAMLTEDEEADALNDLGYLRALGSDLKKDAMLREHSA